MKFILLYATIKGERGRIMTKKKKNSGKMIIVVILLCVAIIFGMPYVKEMTANTSSDGESITVEIPQGATTATIGKILKEADLIKSVNIFKVRAKLSDNGNKMNYGTFNLHKGMCIPDIVDALAGQYAYRETVRLTVPEGFSVEQIAKRCEELNLCTSEEFLNALNDDYSFDLPKVDGVRYNLQGFLYPETYEFFTDATAHEIIEKMLDQFMKEWENANLKTDKSLYEIVTIASLIEREALLEREMPTISGVIYNRLKKGQRLEIDASVQYVVSDGLYDVNRILYSHLEVDSPYNTYRISALPIGPICNPSIQAIKAACNPENHEYLYYHTDKEKNDGSHVFTKTFEEHIQ
ncbi:MAG: endolytic transglycosylase MltG [Clostridia bacterium]